MPEDTVPTLQVLADRLTRLERCVEGHDIFIDGNGTPGIKARMAVLELQFAQVDKKITAVLAMLVGMIMTGAGITIWFITTALPALYGHIGP